VLRVNFETSQPDSFSNSSFKLNHVKVAQREPIDLAGPKAIQRASKNMI